MMKRNGLQERLIGVFLKLRQQGISLSITDLLEALRLLESDGPNLPSDVWQKNLELLWGGSDRLPRQVELKIIWDTWFGEFNFESAPQDTEEHPIEAIASLNETSTTAESPVENPRAESPASHSDLGFASNPESSAPAEIEIAPETDKGVNEEPVDVTEKKGSPKRDGEFQSHRKEGARRRFGRLGNPPPILRVRSETPALAPSVGGVPIVVPPMSKESLSVVRELFAYAPISRLSMAYAWRYLRRPVIDGPADFLDVQATIKLVAQQGFFLSPVYKRRQSNHAHLVLLIDQGGSMVPFRNITEDVVNTAQQETSIKEVNVFYFHNIVADIVYTDEYLTQWLELGQALKHCDFQTSILIVSDGGAARGSNDPQRIEATERMLAALKRRTSLVAWLNPIPRVRWEGCSAEAISKLSQMFQMSPDDFSSAIDSLQGRGATL